MKLATFTVRIEVPEMADELAGKLPAIIQDRLVHVTKDVTYQVIGEKFGTERMYRYMGRVHVTVSQ